MTTLTLAQREANTEVFVEENACTLFDPNNEWCEPAIAFAQWKAEDTEGLRSDGEHDSARRHAIFCVGLHFVNSLHNFYGSDLDVVSPQYLAELIVDHFDDVWNGENAEPLPSFDDEDKIPFDAPATPRPSNADLFQQVDDLLRAQFGLPPKPRF